MPNPLVLHLRRRDELSPDEEEAIERLTQRRQTFSENQELVAEGTAPKQSCLLLKGFAYRQHITREGRRSISQVHVPGDFVDLHSLLLDKIDHSVVSASKVEVSWVAHSDLRRLTETHPHLTRLLWMATTVDAAITRRAISVVGRYAPQARLAHLACELYVRLSTVGEASDLRFRFPATQVDLADMFGLSTVHLNRSLQDLRSTGVVTWDAGEIVIRDWDRLVDIGQFDVTHLSLKKARR